MRPMSIKKTKNRKNIFKIENTLIFFWIYKKTFLNKTSSGEEIIGNELL
jgi:hypothetical protein